jgi:single-strand DNA-binding protein
MLNSVNIIGNLTRDPELRNTASTEVANLRVAVQRRKRNGEDQGADYVNVVAFGTTAQFAAKYLSKGRQIAVKGRLHHNEWTDNDGNRREALEVIADEIHGLARPNSAGKPDAEHDVQIDVADFEPAPPADDDIPF